MRVGLHLSAFFYKYFQYMDRSKPPAGLIASLFVFIFAGAIVGETAALSIVISVAGSEILSKLYLINGILLFLLPAFFFKNIDRVNRGRLLSTLLLVTSVLILTFLVGLQLTGRLDQSIPDLVLWAIYPVSYLSKTVMFLTFWTLANDMYSTNEAKKEFPRIAAWGFLGGLSGALIAKSVLGMIETEAVLVLWAACYMVALLISRHVTNHCRFKLMNKEFIPTAKSTSIGILREVEDVLSINLVRLISILYFFVFLAIFSLDYLFWNKCHLWFPSPSSLASFQFSFYLAHGIVTVLGLWFVMPGLIRKLGFTRIFFFLPFVLLFGATISWSINQFAPQDTLFVFVGMTAFQFARYVIFENAFSPVYQMFFAAIPKEKRGRAKTILEGVIKPASIITTGMFLMLVSRSTSTILIIIAVDACLMIIIISRIRKTYMRGLLPDLVTNSSASDIVAKIGSQYDQNMLMLLQEYSQSGDADLRALAVKILSHFSSRQALKILKEIYQQERDITVKEMVARSLRNFYWYETKTFIEELIKSPEPRIRANAVNSLTHMNCQWKWQLRNSVKKLLFEPCMRVQIEAAQFLWKTNDEKEQFTILGFLDSLISSKNTNKRSAGIYLLGVLKPQMWESKILEHLCSSSLQIYRKSVEVIFRSSSLQSQLKMLQLVESMSRKHIAICGEIAQEIGTSLVQTLINYIKVAQNRRMLVEVVYALRNMLDSKPVSNQSFSLDLSAKNKLISWITDELKGVYRDGYMWHVLSSKGTLNKKSTILEDALLEQMFKVCEWALYTIALLEGNTAMQRVQKDLDLKDSTQRHDLSEIVGNYSNNKITKFIIPILEFRSWALIGKMGRQYFHFSDPDGADIQYFVRSRNKWISLCAMYWLYYHSDSAEIFVSQKEYLFSLRNDPYHYLARAAGEIIRAVHKGPDIKMETFDLLNNVLFFKKTLLFRKVPAEKLMGLAEISQLVRYSRNTFVSKEGEISDHLYIVKEGSLKILKVKNGIRTILSIIRQGEAYGEIGLFNEAPRSASAIANEDCEVYVIKRSSLKKLLMNIPEITYNFLEIFSEKLRRNGEEVALLHTSLSGKFKEDIMIGN